ncbi:MAG: hypothetical protein OEX82_02860 [Nitrosomonas sp.]|nr:hypothetical protein [Nitrosomonas sp.]
MKTAIISLTSALVLFVCISMGYAQTNDAAPVNTGPIKPLPTAAEAAIRNAAGISEVEYIIVVGKGTTGQIAKVFSGEKATSSKIYHKGEVISNGGIKNINTISIVEYKRSHCSGLSYTYVENGQVIEICY